LRAPRLLTEGEVLAVEKEIVVDFPYAGTAPRGTASSEVNALIPTVRLMARPDVVWRRRSDGQVYIRNLKTTRHADDRWREKWALDMQTLSEPLAVDKWLHDFYWNVGGINPKPYTNQSEPDTCGGVIIDGLVTGTMTKNRRTGLMHHNNPLVYAWVRGDGESKTFSAEYKPGWEKLPVAEYYSGGIIAWIDNLITHDITIVDEQLIELPPIIRSPWHIDRWKAQALGREVDIHRWGKAVNVADVGGREVLLDRYFPMSTSEGNCLYPGKCSAYDCCWGSAAGDPLGSGLYRIRTPNHEHERATMATKEASKVAL
jgi:hypothetical protein